MLVEVDIFILQRLRCCWMVVKGCDCVLTLRFGEKYSSYLLALPSNISMISKESTGFSLAEWNQASRVCRICKSSCVGGLVVVVRLECVLMRNLFVRMSGKTIPFMGVQHTCEQEVMNYGQQCSAGIAEISRPQTVYFQPRLVEQGQLCSSPAGRLLLARERLLVPLP